MQLRRHVSRWVALSAVVVMGACGGVVDVDGCLAPCKDDFPDPNYPKAVVFPATLEVAVGDDATFNVDTTGLTTPTYQWYRTSRGGSLQQLVGATTATYTLVSAQRSDDGAEFQVMVDGGIGAGVRLSQISSKGTLTVR